MDRNLGASRVATSSTDADAYGDLYQWGRATEGHEVRNHLSGATSTNANTAVPGSGENDWDGLFITEGNDPGDWLTTQVNTLWQGVNGTNNPCPSGFRLPTWDEWDTERQSWATNNAAGAFNSPLKLTVAGDHHHGTGALGAVGSGGIYWTSRTDGTEAEYLFFKSDNASLQKNYRAWGFSVRCIKD